jgi:tryptophan 2,3-dioxygenase
MTDSLLNLQVQRTLLPDEMVFIGYHQINELIFKMILWEIRQVVETNNISDEFFIEKLKRISRYFDMLSSSFEIMGDGMEKAQYEKFRTTLTPASGFQSCQYRLIELASTKAIHLIDHRYRNDFGAESSAEEIYEHLYWQAAGKDFKTGEKSLLIQLFEKKYKKQLLEEIELNRDVNLWSKFETLSDHAKQNPILIQMMRHYDYSVNIEWVMAHYHAAAKYLGDGAATGGSPWQKYMHPKYQRRIFFPKLWSEEELENWGQDC